MLYKDLLNHKNEIIKLYTEDKLSSTKIAEKFGNATQFGKILKILKKNSIPIRSVRENNSLKSNTPKVPTEQFTHNFTPETVYILGLLWADGYLNNHIDKRRGSRYQQIILKTARPDHDHFYKILTSTGKWSNKYHPATTEHSEYGKASTNNKTLMTFLLENDYATKSWISADKILSKIPLNMHNYWFLGLLDGDGTINIQKDSQKVAIYSGVNQDWSYLTNKLNTLHVKHSKFIKYSKIINQKGSSEIYFNKLDNVIKFMNFLYSSPKAIELGLPRKYKKFLELKQRQDDLFKSRETIFIHKNPNKSKITYSVAIWKLGKRQRIGKISSLEEAIKIRDSMFWEMFGDDYFKEFFGKEYQQTLVANKHY